MRGSLVFSWARFAAMVFWGVGTAHGATISIGGHVYEGATTGTVCAGGLNHGAACSLDLDCPIEMGVCNAWMHCDIGGTNKCVEGPRIGETCLTDEECGGTCGNSFRIGAPCFTPFECDALGRCAGMPVFGGTPITDATVMVQNQHSGGAFIAYGTVGGACANCWEAVVPDGGEYVIMFSAPGYDLTSREVAVDGSGAVLHPKQDAAGITMSTDATAIDAYLPPLFTKIDGTANPGVELPTANLLVYAFYDFMVNGEPDAPSGEDESLNGVTFTVCPEDDYPGGPGCVSGVTGTQTLGGGPTGTITLPSRCGGLRMPNTGLYYFTGLPPGEVIITSDASTVTAAVNTFVRPLAFSLPDATREWYQVYTEEGGPTWDPKLMPNDCGIEDGGFLIWHGYVETIGQGVGYAPGDPTSAGYTAGDKGSISGCLLDADGNDPEEPLPPPPGPSGVTLNARVPDGLIILFTAGEAGPPPHPVATAEADPVTGTYAFTDVKPGKYKIMAFDVPLEYVWVQTQITVVPGGAVVGSCNPALLSPADPWIPRFFGRGQGYVVDRTGKLPTDPLYDGSGIPLDPKMSGETVHLRYKSGSIKKELTTDGTGWYNFDDMPEIEVLGHVDVALPGNYHGAMVEETFKYNVNFCKNEADPPSSSGDPCRGDHQCPSGEVCDYLCPHMVGLLPDPGTGPCPGTIKTHNAMNRYIQWFTANYRADLFIEKILAGTGDVRGVVWYDHSERTLGGGWEGDGSYDPAEERTLHGVTVELSSSGTCIAGTDNESGGCATDADCGAVPTPGDCDGTAPMSMTTTTGKVIETDLLLQGWTKPYTKPADEWGGVYVGPAIGYYEFRGLAPGSYVVKVIPPSLGHSGSPTTASETFVVAVVDGSASEHNFGLNTRVVPASPTAAPLAGEVEGGVFDDLNIDTNPGSTMFEEKAAIPYAPVGVYDHLGYLLGVGYQGDPNCNALNNLTHTPGDLTDPFACKDASRPMQKPEMEKRFAPGVHIYLGNDPAFPVGHLANNPLAGFNANFPSLVMPYTFGQDKFKFEADWSLPPAGFNGLGLPVAPGAPIPPPGGPVILAVTPTGSYSITGSNFGSERGRSTVTLSGEELDVTWWSDTLIHVGNPPVGVSGPMLVTTTAGPSNASYVETGYTPGPSVYVDASNTGTEDGSEANPWNTIGEALLALPSTSPGTPRYVFVGAGRYVEHVRITENDVYIVGAGPVETTVDGTTPAPPGPFQGIQGGGPVFFIGAGGESGSVDNVMISGLTITGGSVKNDIGAGVFGDYGNTNIDINNNMITHNAGYYGGAIWLHKSNHNVRIWSNTIAENGAWGGYAGGISVNDEPEYGPEHGQPEHIGDDNNCGDTPPGTYDIFNNHIYHNFGYDYGGALCLYEVKDHLNVYGNLIEHNWADDHGGGAYFEDTGPIDVYENEFLRNFSRDDGGAISFEDVGDCLSVINVYNNLFAENIADDCGENTARGGALAFDDTFHANVFNNTIVNNIVAGSWDPAGGGIDSERHGHEYNGSEAPLAPYIAPGYSDVAIYNNIIWGNKRLTYEQGHGTEEDACFHVGGRNPVYIDDNLHVDNYALQAEWQSQGNSASFTWVEYNDLGPSPCDVTSEGPCDYSDRTGNISVDPMFVDSSASDWHLSTGAPAINQVPAITAPERDLERNLRRVDDGMVEMGAYEFGACDWCIFDLNTNGAVDGYDFAAFSGCFGVCYPPGEPCLWSNFDEDSNGCIGTGDFAGFAGCFALSCADCTNCAGPGAMSRTSSAMAQGEFDASVRLVTVAEPTLYDHADVLPASTEVYGLREVFFVEVWASRADAAVTSEEGLAAVFVDLAFDAATLQALEITHGEPFSLLAGGFVDDAAGRVRTVGGCRQLGVTTAGVESAWARIATVEMRAIAAGRTRLTSGPSGEPFGISIIDRFGDVDASVIDFGQTQLTLGSGFADPPRRMRKRGVNARPIHARSAR